MKIEVNALASARLARLHPNGRRSFGAYINVDASIVRAVGGKQVTLHLDTLIGLQRESRDLQAG